MGHIIQDTQAKCGNTVSSFYFNVSIQLQESPKTMPDNRVIIAICREEISRNTSLTGVPVKLGKTLKNHSIFCTNEKILKNSVDII